MNLFCPFRSECKWIYIFRQCTYIVLSCNATKPKSTTKCSKKSRNKRPSHPFFTFLTVVQHESGIIKTLSWWVTVYNTNSYPVNARWLLKLINWFSINLMKANPDKFQAIVIGKKTNKHNLTFNLNGNDIQGRIQDLWLGCAWVGEGSGDRWRSPAGRGQSPGRGPGGKRQFWTNHTIVIRPKKLDFES